MDVTCSIAHYGETQDGDSTHWGVLINSKETIDAVLALKTWAIVGLGNNPERAAFGVAKLLQDKGHRIIPVYPRAEVVHGETGYKTLSDIPESVDVVDCIVIDCISKPDVCSRGFLAVKFLINRQKRSKRSKRSKKCCVRKRKRKRKRKIKLDNKFFSLC